MPSNKSSETRDELVLVLHCHSYNNCYVNSKVGCNAITDSSLASVFFIA